MNDTEQTFEQFTENYKDAVANGWIWSLVWLPDEEVWLVIDEYKYVIKQWPDKEHPILHFIEKVSSVIPFPNE